MQLVPTYSPTPLLSSLLSWGGTGWTEQWARICKTLRSPGIDSVYLPYRPARGYIGWRNRFLGSLKFNKFHHLHCKNWMKFLLHVSIIQINPPWFRFSYKNTIPRWNNLHHRHIGRDCLQLFFYSVQCIVIIEWKNCRCTITSKAHKHSVCLLCHTIPLTDGQSL